MICGSVICMPFLEFVKSENPCGGFSEHNKNCQGNSGLYLKMSNGGIIIFRSGRFYNLDSPYLTKFGESMTVTHDQDEDYTLSASAFQELENMMVQDKIGQLALKKQTETSMH